MKNRILTVLGPIDPNNLGKTLAHEHLQLNFEFCLQPAPYPQEESLVDCPFSMENIAWIQRNPYSHRRNLGLRLDVQDVIVKEVEDFKAWGGSCIVDCTTIGIARDVKFSKAVAERTGVHVIAGAGYYVGATHPLAMNQMKAEEIAKQLVNEVTIGADGTDIRCGIIGEIGCSWPLLDNEKKSLRGAAAAQKQLGCALNIHPGRNTEAPFEIVRILLEAGASVDKIVMSHLDRTILDQATLTEFGKLGTYCEFDLFGMRLDHYPFAPHTAFPCDRERVRLIKWLVDDGCKDRILMAHDIHTMHRLTAFGGHGFSHILRDIPILFRDYSGLDAALFDHIMINNPREAFQFLFES